MQTAIINAARDIVNGAIGSARSAEEDLGMEEFDVALDHLRIARETIVRAEAAVRKMIADELAQLASDEASERIIPGA